MPVLRGMRKELVPSLLKDLLPRPVLVEVVLLVPTTGALAVFSGIGAVGLGSGKGGGFGDEKIHITNSPRLIQ
tara:strand:+ start:396 stop:614 length:219 start_codon:yes stop_codon:yes gene_type:complete